MPERWPDDRVVLQGELPNPAHRPHRLCFTHCSRADGAMRENPFWTNIITWWVCSCRRLSRSEETVEYAEKIWSTFYQRALSAACWLCFVLSVLHSFYTHVSWPCANHIADWSYIKHAVFHKQWGGWMRHYGNNSSLASMHYFMEIRQYLWDMEDLW